MDTKERPTPWKDSKAWTRIPDHDDVSQSQAFDWIAIFIGSLLIGAALASFIGFIIEEITG